MKKKRATQKKAESKRRKTAATPKTSRDSSLRQTLDDMSIIHELNIATARGNSLETILSILAARTKKTFKSHGAAVYTLSPNKRFLTLLISPTIRTIIRSLRLAFKIPIPDTLTIVLHEDSFYQKILNHGKPGIVDDKQSIEHMIQEFIDDPVLNKIVPKIHKFLQIGSVMFMPLIIADEPIGIIDMSRKKPFTQQDLKRFQFISQGVLPILSLRKSQRAYDEGRELFTEFVNSADQGFVFCDGNLNITNVNDYLLLKFNVNRNDILGTNLVDLNLGIFESGLYDALLKVLETGDPVTFDKVHPPPEFGDRVLRVKARRIGDNLILIVDDITDEHEDELQLRESETVLRSIVEEHTDLICRFTPDKVLTFVNTAYCDYFNKTKWELIGSSFLDLIDEKDRSYVINEIDKLDKDHPVGILEERVVLSDGSIRWQQWINRAIFDEPGTIIEYQSVGRDITDLKTKKKKKKKRKA